jgi:hypothetical protein
MNRVERAIDGGRERTVVRRRSKIRRLLVLRRGSEADELDLERPCQNT